MVLPARTTPFAAATLALFACGPEDLDAASSYEQLARDCPLEAADGGAPVAGYGVSQPITATCATTVGRLFRFDWDSFGESPRAFADPVTPAEVVIAGVVIASGVQGRTVADITAKGAPADLRLWLRQSAGRAGGADDDDAGATWFEFVSAALHEVQYTGSDGYLMSYHDKSANVGSLGATDDEPWVHVSAISVASTLVHEAAHDHYGSHLTDCLVGSNYVPCDYTEDGAVGAGAWWTWNWLAGNGSRLEWQSESSLNSEVEFDCARIVDPTGFPPCTDTP
mgnify:CR=1 FL=1